MGQTSSSTPPPQVMSTSVPKTQDAVKPSTSRNSFRDSHPEMIKSISGMSQSMTVFSPQFKDQLEQEMARVIMTNADLDKDAIKQEYKKQMASLYQSFEANKNKLKQYALLSSSQLKQEFTNYADSANISPKYIQFSSDWDDFDSDDKETTTSTFTPYQQNQPQTNAYYTRCAPFEEFCEQALRMPKSIVNAETIFSLVDKLVRMGIEVPQYVQNALKINYANVLSFLPPPVKKPVVKEEPPMVVKKEEKLVYPTFDYARPSLKENGHMFPSEEEMRRADMKMMQEESKKAGLGGYNGLYEFEPPSYSQQHYQQQQQQQHQQQQQQQQYIPDFSDYAPPSASNPYAPLAGDPYSGPTRGARGGGGSQVSRGGRGRGVSHRGGQQGRGQTGRGRGVSRRGGQQQGQGRGFIREQQQPSSYDTGYDEDGNPECDGISYDDDEDGEGELEFEDGEGEFEDGEGEYEDGEGEELFDVNDIEEEPLPPQQKRLRREQPRQQPQKQQRTQQQQQQQQRKQTTQQKTQSSMRNYRDFSTPNLSRKIEQDQKSSPKKQGQAHPYATATLGDIKKKLDAEEKLKMKADLTLAVKSYVVEREKYEASTERKAHDQKFIKNMTEQYHVPSSEIVAIFKVESQVHTASLQNVKPAEQPPAQPPASQVAVDFSFS